MQAVSPGPVDALLFDLGGVVIEIDFDRVLARWALHARTDYAALKSRFSFDPSYQRHERGEIDVAAYFASLRTTLGIDLSDAQFMDGWNELFVGEIPGIADLLRRARARLPLYALTNSNPAHQQVWTREYASLLGLFRAVFVSSEIGQRKPELGAFQAVGAAIGVPLSRILFFDDSLENVEGAKASGLRAVHVGSPADVERALKAILD